MVEAYNSTTSTTRMELAVKVEAEGELAGGSVCRGGYSDGRSSLLLGKGEFHGATGTFP